MIRGGTLGRRQRTDRLIEREEEGGGREGVVGRS